MSVRPGFGAALSPPTAGGPLRSCAPETSLPLGRRILYLLAPYVVFVGALGALELAVRFALPPLSSLELFVTAPQQHAQFRDRAGARIVEGDPLLFWRLRPNLDHVVWDQTLVSTNAQGLRYPRGLGRKEAGTFRVVALGDSVTFGYRVPWVNTAGSPRRHDGPESPYPALLEQRLRAANPSRAVEVVPLAVPGYSSHQGLAWLRRDIAALEPDLVTACFGWNDVSPRPASDDEVMRTDWPSVTARRIVSRSQALAHLARAVRSWRAVPRSREVMRVPEDRHVLNMLEIARLARSHGAGVAVLGPVYRDRVTYPPTGDHLALHREALRRAMAGASVPYLEIPELTERWFPGNRPLFSEEIHPNHRGHALIAERLLAFLAERRLLGDLRIAAPGESAAPAHPATDEG
jgi:lysophospholipase L1-like esterase